MSQLTSDKKKSYPYHRRFVRHSIRLRIIVHSDQKQDTWTHNISQDGICFDIPRRLPEGRSLALRMYLPDKKSSDPIVCQCRIVWSELSRQGYRHGGQFTSFEGAGFRRLKAYLQTKAVKSGE